MKKEVCAWHNSALPSINLLIPCIKTFHHCPLNSKEVTTLFHRIAMRKKNIRGETTTQQNINSVIYCVVSEHDFIVLFYFLKCSIKHIPVIHTICIYKLT